MVLRRAYCDGIVTPGDCSERGIRWKVSPRHLAMHCECESQSVPETAISDGRMGALSPPMAKCTQNNKQVILVA
eukprot:5067049-Amphidinium_carterae.1